MSAAIWAVDINGIGPPNCILIIDEVLLIDAKETNYTVCDDDIVFCFCFLLLILYLILNNLLLYHFSVTACCWWKSTLPEVISDDDTLGVCKGFFSTVRCLTSEWFEIVFVIRILQLSVHQENMTVINLRPIVHCWLDPKVTLSNSIRHSDDTIWTTLPILVNSSRPRSSEMRRWSEHEGGIGWAT